MDAKLSAAQLMELENKHGAHNYHPVPVVLDKGEGWHLLQNPSEMIKKIIRLGSPE